MWFPSLKTSRTSRTLTRTIYIYTWHERWNKSINDRYRNRELENRRFDREKVVSMRNRRLMDCAHHRAVNRGNTRVPIKRISKAWLTVRIGEVSPSGGGGGRRLEDHGQNTEGQSTGGASRRDGALFASLRIGCRRGDRPYTLTVARIGCHSSCRFRVFVDLVYHATIQNKRFVFLFLFFFSLFFNRRVPPVHFLFFANTGFTHRFVKSIGETVTICRCLYTCTKAG